MKRVIYLFLTFPLFFVSCEKESGNNDSNNTISEKVTDYFPLSVGNYWIYQQYSCDSLEFDCEEYRIDSVYISDTAIINGNKYFKLVRSNPNNDIEMFVRDSGDYIVDSYGRVLFAINHFNTILYEREEHQNDTILMFTSKYSVAQQKEYKTFNENVFECYNFLGEIYIINDDFSEPRYCNNYYAKGVGLVYENEFYLSSEKGIKREIIRYKIN